MTCYMARKRVMAALASVVTATLSLNMGVGSALAESNDNPMINPFSPAANHPYRHGVVPTRDQHEKMESWRKSNNNAATAAATGPKTLSYGGGIDGIGVTSGKPKVYIVVYGTQWGTAGTDGTGNMTLSNDKVGAVRYMQSLFKNIGTGGELWSGVMTQYCDGPLVSKGATSCPSGANFVGYPSGGAFAGIWYDNSTASPSYATASQLGQEAVRAAAHFGNTTAASNRYAQYIIMSPSGTTPDGFNTYFGNFCAWHSYTGDSHVGVSSSYGDIAFTNMPYVYDAGKNCATGSVNSGAQGNLDGFSIVAGHEYAETITDQNPAGGWTNTVSGSASNGQENGDECAWIASGQGAMQNVTMGSGTFAMQSTWSNDTNQCEISHPIVSSSGSTTTTTQGGTTTTSTTTTTTTVVAGACFSTSNSAHVAAGRAHDYFGYAYANGSNQLMGFDNAFYSSKLRQTATNYYVIDNTCP